MIIKKATKIVRKVSLGILSLSLVGTVSVAPALAENWTLTGSDIWNSNFGNVGIGTAVPLTKFHFIADTVDLGFITAPRIQAQGITGGNGDMVNLTLFSNNNGVGYASGLAFSMLNSESSPVEYARIRSVIVDDTSGSEDGALDLMVKQNGTLTYPVRITNEGRVGIETTVPEEKLTVSGKISSTGSTGTVTTAYIYLPGWYEQVVTFPTTFSSTPAVILTHDNNGTGDVQVDIYRVKRGTLTNSGFTIEFYVSGVYLGENTTFTWMAMAY